MRPCDSSRSCRPDAGVNVHADTAATQASLPLTSRRAKERQHATVHHIAETHGMFQDLIRAARC